MLRLRGALVLAAALLVPAAPAPAATTAQRFADAVERAKSAIKAERPEVRAAVAAAEYPRCRKAFDTDASLPAGEDDRLGALLVTAQHWAVFGPTRPALERLVADLNAIPTRDPRLRSGRSAWRAFVAGIAAYPFIDRPCQRLEAWASSGWNPDLRPPIDVAAFRQAERVDSDALPGKLRRAGRRLRELGVSKGDAERFTGVTLFDDIDDLTTVFEGSPE